MLMKDAKTEKILEKIYKLRNKKTDSNNSNKFFIEQFYIIKELHNNTLKKNKK